MSDILARYFQACRDAGHLTGISFELTNECNLSCSHCYRVHGTRFIPGSIFKTAVDEAESLGALLVSFNGGEPTLHPEFEEFTHSVVSRGMYLSVLTNGTLLTEPMLKRLSPYKNLFFQISLYGSDPTSSQLITGDSSSFQATMDSISLIQQIGFDFRVILLVTSFTADGLPSMVEHLRANKVKIGLIFQISAREDGSKAPLLLAAKDNQMLNLFRYEGSWRQEIQEPVANSSVPIITGHACNAGVSSVGIRTDGAVVPCQVFSTPVLGVIGQDSIASILAGQKRRAFLLENSIPEKCGGCNLFSACLRCPADAFHETGNLIGIPDESCRIARLRAKFHIDSPK